MRITLTLIACLFAIVAPVTSTKGNFEGSGKHEKETEDHAPILLEHESHTMKTKVVGLTREVVLLILVGKLKLKPITVKY